MPKTRTSRPTVAYRLGHMGDVALATGVLLRRFEMTGQTFVFVTRASNAPLLANHPAVAGIEPLTDADLKDESWWKVAGRLADKYRGADLLDLHGTLRSRILALRWQGKVSRYPKFGMARRLYGSTRMDLFRRRLEATTVPQRYAMALESTPPPAGEVLPRLFLTDDELAGGKTRLADLGLASPVIALHPYATHPSKQWPREHWIELARILDQRGLGWFVVGRDDEPLFPGDPRDLTNGTDLRQTCAALAAADVMVTNDSGPMHLASGVGTPVVALFGPTARAWGFMPAGPHDVVLQRNMDCRPCSLHGASGCPRGLECLRSIPAVEAADAVAGALAAR